MAIRFLDEPTVQSTMPNERTGRIRFLDEAQPEPAVQQDQLFGSKYGEADTTLASQYDTQLESPLKAFGEELVSPAIQGAAGLVSGTQGLAANILAGEPARLAETRLDQARNERFQLEQKRGELLSIRRGRFEDPETAAKRVPSEKQKTEAQSLEARINELQQEEDKQQEKADFHTDVRKRMLEASQSGWLRPPEDQSIAEWTFRVIGQTIPSVAAAYALAPISPTMGSTMLGHAQGIDTYFEAREAGIPIDEAQRIYQLEFALSTAMEIVPLDNLNKMNGGKIKRGIMQGSIEAAQEVADTVKSNLIAKNKWDENRDWYEGWKEALVGGFGAAALTAGAGIGSPSQQDQGISPQQAQEAAPEVVQPTVTPEQAQLPTEEIVTPPETTEQVLPQEEQVSQIETPVEEVVDAGVKQEKADVKPVREKEQKQAEVKKEPVQDGQQEVKQIAEQLQTTEKKVAEELERQTFATQETRQEISPDAKEMAEKVGLRKYTPISHAATQSEVSTAIKNDGYQSSKDRVLHDTKMTQTQRLAMMRELATIADNVYNAALAQNDEKLAKEKMDEYIELERNFLETSADTARALEILKTSPMHLSPEYHVRKYENIIESVATPKNIKKRAKQLKKRAKQLKKRAKQLKKEAKTAKPEVTAQRSQRKARRDEIKNRVISKLDKMEVAAKERMQKRIGRLQAGIDPEALSDLAIVGATKMAKGATKFTAWSSQMVDDFGATIKPHLKKIWTAAKDRLSKEQGTARDEVNKLSASFFVEKAAREIGEANPEVVEEIRKRVMEAKKKPKGFQQYEALKGVSDYIINQVPVSNTDIIVSMIYANMLSGHETHMVNILDTFGHVLGEAVTLTIAEPKPQAIRLLWSGWAEGYKMGFNLAEKTVKKGPLGMDLKETIGGSSILERVDSMPNKIKTFFTKGRMNPFRLFKFVGRFLSAEDTLHFGAAREMRARLAAYQIAKQEGLKGAALSERVHEVLGTDIGSRKDAKDQAVKEGLHGVDREIRITEIMYQNRPEDINILAEKFARRATYNNNEGGGLLRYWADLLGKAGRAPVGGKLSLAFRMQVPFTRVVGNVIERKMDYTPLGYVRMFMTMNEARSPLESIERRQGWIKATVGTTVMGILGNLGAAFLDDDDPPFAIYGAGPRSTKQRHQWMETGARPWSAKIGNVYLPYQDTLFGLGLALIGSYHDGIRYKKLSQEDALTRVAYILQESPQVVLDMSFLQSLKRFFNASAFEQKPDKQKAAIKLIRTARSLATPNALRQISRIFDPKIYTDDNIKEALIKDMPIARSRFSKPIINVFGDPIRENWTLLERSAARFISLEKRDPVAQFLAKNNLWIPWPEKSKAVRFDGKIREITPEEYYKWIELSGHKLKADIEEELPVLKTRNAIDLKKEVYKIVRDARNATLNEALIKANRRK